MEKALKNKVLELLRQQDDYVSGEHLSRKLKISRAGIWKNIGQLRKCGYDIEAVSHNGYRLIAVPDKLFPDEIRYGLGSKCMGTRIHHFEELPSTMDYAVQVGLAGAPEGTLICAEAQSAGRGRLGRKWQSPKTGGLYFSIILRPNVPLNGVAVITLMSAVAVCEAMRKSANVDAKIKWPNDILIDGKKCAGILTEMNAEMDRIRFLVLGVGININTNGKQLLAQATSLRKHTGKKHERVKVLQEVLGCLEDWYGLILRVGNAPVLERWRQLSMTLGQEISITDQAGTLTGQAVDIDENGGLLVRQKNGTVVKRMSGEVEIKSI
jgi:BirA family biotin operon repressor/biotin-[acetyl-CoA-carboxylase] ligase